MLEYLWIPLTYFLGILFRGVLDIHDTKVSSMLDDTMKKISLNYQYLILAINLIVFVGIFYLCYFFSLTLIVELFLILIINVVVTLVLAQLNNNRMIKYIQTLSDKRNNK